MNFSNEKSQVLVVNGNDSDSGRTWKLGENEIRRTKEYKYSVFGYLVG